MNLASAATSAWPAARRGFDTRFLDPASTPAGPHLDDAAPPSGCRPRWRPWCSGQVPRRSGGGRVGLAWRCVGDDELVDAAVAMAAGRPAPRELTRRVRASVLASTVIDDHDHAVERELIDQLWSMDQLAFAERLATLQRRISNQG